MANEDPWLLAQAEEDGFPVLFRMRELVPGGVRVQDYPFLVNIYWQYEESSSGGMPTAEMNDQMVKFEEILDPLEGPGIGYMVLTITGNGRKEWIWYVRNQETFKEGVRQALSSQGRFPVELQAAEDPQWDNFRRLLSAVKSQTQ